MLEEPFALAGLLAALGASAFQLFSITSGKELVVGNRVAMQTP